MADLWQAGTVYANGAIVQSQTYTAGVKVAIPNYDIESGAVDWNFGGDIVLESGTKYQGANSIRVNSTGTSWILNTTAMAVVAGKSISADCMYLQGGASAGVNTGNVSLVWYTAGMIEISKSEGTIIKSSNGGWKKSTVTGVAPATAAFVKIGARSIKGASNPHFFDYFTWNLYTASSATNGLEFKAVQAGNGTSASVEPVWGTMVGDTVIDGTVTWQAISITSVTWQASPILISGGTEPTWIAEAGAFTLEADIQWEAISMVVSDEKCPQSKVVAIAASKVFAGDDDITRFSATVNPLDWSSERDAGYLATGLNQAGSNSVSVINIYKNNLVVFNANSFQMWQIDPDPELMALLDQMQGIGSIYQQAAQSVADDLFYMSAQGVRTVGVSASSESLESGDVGTPIDSLVIPSVASAVANGLTPRATYYTGMGQYWLVTEAVDGKSIVYVYTQNQIGRIGSWSRYVFPYQIDGFATLGNDLYIRATVLDGESEVDSIYKMDEALTEDDGTPVNAIVQWNWLDCGQAGITKMLETVDIVGNGTPPTISIGYDQTNPFAVTTPYQLQADSLTGMPVPIPVSAPTFSIKLEYATGGWELQQFMLEVRPNGKIR